MFYSRETVTCLVRYSEVQALKTVLPWKFSALALSNCKDPESFCALHLATSIGHVDNNDHDVFSTTNATTSIFLALNLLAGLVKHPREEVWG